MPGQAWPGKDHGQLGAEAGPLIGLARIGCLDLLRALFGGVTITAVVAAEIGIDADPDVRADRRPGASAIAEARAAGWLSISWQSTNS